MAIEMKDVAFSYPKSEDSAVEHINLVINKGERVAIIGQNGAGKTTMVKLMNNIYKPSSGSISIDGINTRDKTTAQIAPYVGYVFQNPNDQIFNDDIESEVEYVLRYWKLPEKEIQDRASKAIELSGIKRFKHIHPYDIPLPIRKFLAIAVILAVNPGYFILDEPTAGQDEWGRNQLRKIMDYLQEQGKSIITISHDMEFVAENFNRIIVMAHKNIICDGEKRDIFYNLSILSEARIKAPMYTQIAQEVSLKAHVLYCQELVDAIP